MSFYVKVSFTGMGRHGGHFQIWNTEHFFVHFYCQGHGFGPQEAEGHLQSHVRGHFQTQRQNPGVIFKHRHTFSRQEQHFHVIVNVFICQGIHFRPLRDVQWRPLHWWGERDKYAAPVTKSKRRRSPTAVPANTKRCPASTNAALTTKKVCRKKHVSNHSRVPNAAPATHPRFLTFIFDRLSTFIFDRFSTFIFDPPPGFQGQCWTAWWFQSLWNILVKLKIFP